MNDAQGFLREFDGRDFAGAELAGVALALPPYGGAILKIASF